MQDETPPSQKISLTALPRSEDDAHAWLRLVRSRRVGPATFIRLMREYGSARAALAALPDIASQAGAREYAPAATNEIETEWRAAETAGARPLYLGAPDYPALLATISDAPPFVWAVGAPKIAVRPTIALVGARNASALGRRMASRLANELGAAGFVVVSGLARGIDSAVHEATIGTGALAVVAGGVDVVYPAENAALAAQIASQGCILSEMPMGHDPRAADFPRRNRIVSGLALGVVVVEGALRSGSLITARAALDQGREVMAVPGSPMDGRAGGCNALIRDGATLVRSAEDVVEALNLTLGVPEHFPSQPEPTPKGPPPARETETEASGAARQVLALLGPTPAPEDAITRELGQPAATVAATLLELELEGRIRRHPGGLISLAVD